MLAERSHSAALWLLLAGVLLMHVADYLIIPILPVVLRLDRGLAAGQVGLVLGSTAFFFLSGSLLGGTLADRLGRRTVMMTGSLLRAGGLVGLGVLAGLPWLLAAAAIGGLGTGLFAPAVKAAIAALGTTGQARTTAFSWRGIAANMGIGVAGLGVLVLAGRPGAVNFFVAAGIHLVLGAVTWLMLPQACEEPMAADDRDCPTVQPGAVMSAFRNRVFITFGAAAFLLWTLYAQLTLVLPLRAAAVLATPKTIGLIWTVKSVVVILTQALVTRLVIRRLHPVTAMSCGALLLGAGLAGLGFADSFWGLAAAAIVFVAGEMLVMPTFDSTVSQLAPAGQVGIFFGVANFVSGLGESAGHVAGGQWLEATGGGGGTGAWLMYGGAGGLIAGALFLLRRWQPLRTALSTAAAAPAVPAEAPHAAPSPALPPPLPARPLAPVTVHAPAPVQPANAAEEHGEMPLV